MLDNLPFPVWLRNDKLKIINCNRKFAELAGSTNRETILREGGEINSIGGESVSKELAKAACAANRGRKATVNVVKDGERLVMEAYETPFHAEESLDKIFTAGTLIDVSELDELKRNLKLHQNAQLEILGTLGTAFAVFDQNLRLAFHNHSFAQLWQLEESWFEGEPTYAAFLDTIREKRLLPEVPDYVMFKNEEQKKFTQIIEPQKDMLHLPDGKTLRRLRAAYPMGGLIFAYEDITDRLATTSAYNALLSVQKELLENLFDAVLIFGANGRLNSYNQAYLKLWKAQKSFLDQEPSLDEVLDSQRGFFSQKENWIELKKEIAAHLLSMTTKSFILNRREQDDLEVAARNLSDGSLMISYKKI